MAGAGMADVLVIGGGISGVAAAYELAKAGTKVTLLERGDLASMASGWTLAGVRQSGRHPAELPLAAAAVERWTTLGAELDADIEYRQDGNLRLARTPDEVPVIEGVVTTGRASGLDVTFLPDNAAVRAVAPALSEEILAASLCPTDGHANPTKTVHAFARAAERHGAEIRTGLTVTGIAVNVAGVHTSELLAPLGLDLPLRIGHVAAVQTTPVGIELKQVLGVANANVAGRQQVDGRLRFTAGGTTWSYALGDLASGYDKVQPLGTEIVTLLQRATRIVPAIGEARIARVWGGLLDMTPDTLPVIERAPEYDGLIVAAGFSGHGFCLGPVTGWILADLALRGETALPIEPFRRSRFAKTPIATPDAPTLHG
jgi:sarcosine oxidase subunit beta